MEATEAWMAGSRSSGMLNSECASALFLNVHWYTHPDSDPKPGLRDEAKASNDGVVQYLGAASRVKKRRPEACFAFSSTFPPNAFGFFVFI
ncbi:hypothetical protein O3P69_002070 [Scylla paramamosain]|uniref:Uncharacterized protein n=1 Tax=Scylla paramamosain TaxID=85552 RepID=A0AAW0V5H3_SCYPA